MKIGQKVAPKLKALDLEAAAFMVMVETIMSLILSALLPTELMEPGRAATARLLMEHDLCGE